MSYNIEQIEVMLDINIPNKKPVKLTSGMIYIPPEAGEINPKYPLSELPYFTIDQKVPTNGLVLLSKRGYTKIMQFFFNKTYFQRKMDQFLQLGDDEPDDDTSEQENASDAETDVIVKKNISNMLKFLFPTTFPVESNYMSSYQGYILGKPEMNISLQTTNFLAPNKYSYLKMDGTTYTVTRVVWLNDVLNHPLYNSLTKEIYNRTKTSGKNLGRLQREIINSVDTLVANMKEPAKLKLYENARDDANNFIQMFKNNTVDEKSIDSRDLPLKEFNSTLKKLIEKLNAMDVIESYSQGTDYKNDDYNKRINDINTMVKDINRLYDSIKNNARLTGISDAFESRLTRITESTKEIYELNASLLKSASPSKFNEILKTVLSPIRKSSHFDLQQSIIDYNAMKEKSKFSDIITDIYEKMILKNQTVGSDTLKLLYTGINYINLSKPSDPQYEIYVALDVAKGTITNENRSNVSCEHSAHNLGLWAPILFKPQLLVNSKRVYIEVPDDKNTKSSSDGVTAAPDKTKPIKGGSARHKKKYSKKPRHANRKKSKTLKKRC